MRGRPAQDSYGQCSQNIGTGSALITEALLVVALADVVGDTTD